MLLVAQDYELDLSVGEFASLLGFKQKILRNGMNFIGDMIPDISRGVDWVFLHCDLITREAPDVQSDILYSLLTTDLQVSYPFRAEPRRREYHHVNKTRIHSVGIRVTDGRNNPLNLNYVDVALDIMIDKE